MGVVPIMEKIIIKDASENNLKHLDLEFLGQIHLRNWLLRMR